MLLLTSNKHEDNNWETTDTKQVNLLKGRCVNWLHFAHPGLTYILNFWHSGTLALSPERQSARMSEIKNVG